MADIKGIVSRLASLNPEDAAVLKTTEELVSALENSKSSVASSKELIEELTKLHRAAEIPAKNYGRILAITAGLGKAVKLAERPQNAHMASKIADLVKKVSGLFAEVDTVADLDKPLEQIEKAVHSLYGDQSKNHTFYFDARNKGHHSKLFTP